MLIEAPALSLGSPLPEAGYDADIIILALNRYTETIAAVRSACAQICLSFHVWVLDQGSDEETRIQFKNIFAGLNHCSYFEAPRNLGVAGGRNFLSTLGYGRTIIALDNDAVFEKTTVAASALRIFDNMPSLGALAFRIVEPDGSLDEFSWGYPASLKSRYQDRFDTTTFVGAGHAIRRIAWEQVGGYDESLFFTWEEYDFCRAAIACDWGIRYEGSLGIIHHVASEARIAWKGARTEFFVRNRLRIGRKWGASWLQLAPRAALYLVRSALHGGLIFTLRGIIQAVQQDKTTPKRQMPAAMRCYIHNHEIAHRGSWLKRIRHEVLGAARTDHQVTRAKG